MEPLHILTRAVSAYVLLLILMRLSGKRTVLQACAFDVVLTLIVGDMLDDFLWAEVSAAQFVVGVSSIFMCHAFLAWLRILPSQLMARRADFD